MTFRKLFRIVMVVATISNIVAGIFSMFVHNVILAVTQFVCAALFANMLIEDLLDHN